MKRRVCCLVLGICLLCLPVQQVYAAPAGPAANAEEKAKPHEKETEKPEPPKPGEKPVPPHEKKKPVPPHEKPKPHEEKKGPLGVEKPEPPKPEEKPVLPQEKEKQESEEKHPVTTPVATPTAVPTATPTVIPTTEPTVQGSSVGSEVVKYALQFVGNPYKYGGTSLTNGADCSGFVQSVYARFGYSLERSSKEQSKSAGYTDVTPREGYLQPGDLIFYANSSGVVHHVAIYIGNGKIVHAANSTKGIIVSEYTYMKPYKARRVIK